ncbi:endoribonuclease YicC domain-containing protein [Mangrovicoccus sp. HB161399]|uniref:endoribonuclease YicC domain-containing protein n=1 Tax=Mangrovicoccus sp. HB161399 TaxID=2720392 RepID=UPI0015540084|nr:DUF1732 domain-containing protein [Mangrovicoccus sp. HB161399]
MTLSSMTGFAVQDVAIGDEIWSWSLRSAAGRGISLELRLAEGCESLEPAVRSLAAAALQRGHVDIALRPPPAAAARMPEAQELSRMLSDIAALEMAALKAGVKLSRASASDLLFNCTAGRRRPRLSPGGAAEEALLGGLESALAALGRMRRAEGRGLARKLAIQLDHLDALLQRARVLDKERGLHLADQFAAAVRRVLQQASEADPGRLEHELAALAARADIREELGRLEAHALEARGLAGQAGPAGRRLQLVAEELDREADRLREKAHFAELTRLGLDLKTAIDQLRVHIDNVE